MPAKVSERSVARAANVEISGSYLVVKLVDGRYVSVPLEWFPRLCRATPQERSNWKFIGPGIGIRWDDIEEDISVRSILHSGY